MKTGNILSKRLAVVLAICLSLPFGALSFADAGEAAAAYEIVAETAAASGGGGGGGGVVVPEDGRSAGDGIEGEGACTSFYMGKGTTENGSYLWGRSEDTTSSYTKLFAVHEAETHAPGDMYVAGSWNSAFTVFTPAFQWPYPAKTLRYIMCKDSLYNDRYEPEPYAEVGMNEKGVAMSATVSLNATKGAITALDPNVARGRGGLSEADITAVILMQAETARGACELAAQIIDAVGAEGREGFMVSDPNEVWFFQWFSGHQYVAAKCPDDMIGLSPNNVANVGDKDGYVDVTDTANAIVSPGFVSIPKQAGVLVAKDDDTKVMVADTYSGQQQNYQAGRLRVGYGYLYGYTTNAQIAANLPGTKYLDYFAPPREGKKYSLYEALRLLACRGEGTEWEVANPSNNSASIGNTGTLEAHVFETRPGMPPELATIEWLSYGPPEFGVYLPYIGNLVAEAFEKCYSPEPNPRAFNYGDYDANCVYWAFRELYTQCAAANLADRERFGNGVRAFWERYQKSLIEQQAQVDELLLGVLSDAGGYAAAERIATELSMKITEEAYEYAKSILAELVAFKAAGTAGAFIPSALLDDGAIPRYAVARMAAGIDAEDPTCHLAAEFPSDPPGAKFTLRVEDFRDVSYVHLTFSYDSSLFLCAYGLSDYLKANGFEIDDAFTSKAQDGDMENVSLYLRHKDLGGTVAGGAYVELLDIHLVPRVVPTSAAASVSLSHIDVSYNDGAKLAVANVLFSSPVGTSWIYYFSAYDIDRNGAVALADVDAVRRNIGKDSSMPQWDDIAVRRCDLNGDRKIDFLDLVVMISKYEDALAVRRLASAG